MIKTDTGVSFPDEAPVNQVSAVKQFTYNNNSASKEIRKPFEQSLSGNWPHQETKNQLQAYLSLGLTPIPLKGKIPQIKWRHGWNPKTLSDLEPYKKYTNWGIKTGSTLGVIDFDSPEIFAKFAAENMERLPDGLPLIKTGRGFHLWFTPSEPLRDAHFDGIDLKAEGGQVCVPPSIHPVTHQPYRFLWHLGDTIPELDLNKLHFSVKKRAVNKPDQIENIKSQGSNTSIENGNRGFTSEKPRFRYETIANGVDEGERHTALVSYIGHLIWHDLTKDQITTLVTDWNGKNRQPLIKEELMSTVEYCYARYAKDKSQNKNNVPVKTLNKFSSVLTETKNYLRIDRNLSQHTHELPIPTTTQEPVSPWETENDRPPNYFDCGKKRSIARRDREYMSVSFFCGRWDCPRCGPFFRQRWIDHLISRTEGLDLYVTEISAQDWPKVRRAINRLDSDYLKIKSGMVFKVITDKPLKGSVDLKQDDVLQYLESAIPNNAPECPISTSRNWRREKNTKKENDFKKVTVTWLPLKDQLEVAQELGAKKVQYNRWISPEDADDAEWADKFKQGIAERERSILHWLIKPKNSKKILEMATEWQYYLNQQYAEDAVNDEQGYESFLDSYLVEAA